MSDLLRIRRPGVVQTPVHRYRRPDGRQATLVGTCHIGTERYYQELRGIITALEHAGAVVHREGSTQLHPGDDPSTLSPAEQAALHEIVERSAHLARRRAPLLGWVYQLDHLTADTWQTVDLSPITLVRLLGPDGVARTMGRRNALLDWPDDDPLGPLRFHLVTARQFRLTASTITRRVLRRLRPPSLRATDAIIIGRRTTVALDGLRTAAADHDVVLIWGTGHLPALAAGLRADGWTRTTTTWHTVGTLPSTRATLHTARVATATPTPPGHD